VRERKKKKRARKKERKREGGERKRRDSLTAFLGQGKRPLADRPSHVTFYIVSQLFLNKALEK
jgi:hypothetical protein